jgi:hypothetical protein
MKHLGIDPATTSAAIQGLETLLNMLLLVSASSLAAK